MGEGESGDGKHYLEIILFFLQFLCIISLGGGITPTIQATDSWKRV